MDFRDITLGKLLGKGTYGKVYETHHNKTEMAVKYVESDRTGLRELGELNFLNIINHPNIMHCVSFALNRQGMGLIIPLAQSDLYKVMVSKKKLLNDNMDLWVFQIISAVSFLHAHNYYHCDLHSGNILIVNNNAVLADLGLSGSRDIHAQTCQSIISPQLLYHKNKQDREYEKCSDIFKRPSSELKDDVWALGFTILDLVSERYTLRYNDLKSYSDYIKNPEEYFRTNVQKKYFAYIPLLMKLLNPDPEIRTLSTSQINALYPMNRYEKQISGSIRKVVNKNPVMFGEGITSVFTNLLGYIAKNSLFFGNKKFIFECIDLFYRIFPYIEISLDVSCKILSTRLHAYCDACMLVIAKINRSPLGDILRESAKDKSYRDVILDAEVHIVKVSGGILTRKPLVYDYLRPREYNNAISWIIKHPDRYEPSSGFDPERLRSEIVK